jgi:hypothetical protein
MAAASLLSAALAVLAPCRPQDVLDVEASFATADGLVVTRDGGPCVDHGYFPQRPEPPLLPSPSPIVRPSPIPVWRPLPSPAPVPVHCPPPEFCLHNTTAWAGAMWKLRGLQPCPPECRGYLPVRPSPSPPPPPRLASPSPPPCPPSPKCAGECPPLPLSTDRPDKAVDAHRAAGLKTEPLPQWAFRRVTDGGRNELVRLRAKLSEARKAAERQRLWPGEAGFWAIPTAGPRRITPFHQTAR